MFSMTLQALLTVWPFFKRMIFGDRTVKEVLKENIHLTVMMVLVILSLGATVSVTRELNSVKTDLHDTKVELNLLKSAYATDDSVIERRKRLDQLLR